jgi:hypothetical protein
MSATGKQGYWSVGILFIAPSALQGQTVFQSSWVKIHDTGYNIESGGIVLDEREVSKAGYGC